MAVEQVFIGGAPRSGTSIMMRAIRAALPDYKSYDEGHFLEIIPPLFQAANHFLNVSKKTARSRPNFLLHHVEENALRHAIETAICGYAADLMGARNFIDKTPGAPQLGALPAISRCFPNGRAVILRRRALEYMRSAQKKFGGWDEYIGYWLGSIAAIERLEERIPNYVLVVEHRDIVTQPDETARRIGAHLALADDAVARIASTFKNTKVEKTEGTDYAPMKLSELSGDQAVLDDFVNRTKDVFAKIGYSYDENYFAAS